jgi:hypothetical protein
VSKKGFKKSTMGLLSGAVRLAKNANGAAFRVNFSPIEVFGAEAMKK